IGIDSILNYSFINTYELEDEGHWFGQKQIDRFHQLMNKMTGNLNISREAGRYSASSVSLGRVREYLLGFMTPSAAYSLLGKVSTLLTRALLSRPKSWTLIK
ncbi:MAG: hypothetical protein JW944_02900, partial [Deltaproteobacteria bacterium]|nr:hypothetical protein [Deltaproteobacteria bacterium]